MIKSDFIWFQSLPDGASYSPQFFQKSILANLKLYFISIPPWWSIIFATVFPEINYCKLKNLFHFNPSQMELHTCYKFFSIVLYKMIGIRILSGDLTISFSTSEFRLRLYSLFHRFFQPFFWFYLLVMTSRADLMINEAVCLTQKKDFL